MVSINHKILYLSGLMLFFWSVYDGIISYLVPIFITHQGYSNSTVGLLISLSAISGAFFDILISKFVRTPHYLRFFFFVFFICFFFPLILWSATTVSMFVLAMSLWGLYFDLLNFGIPDLAARISGPAEHTKNISIIGVFKTIGYFIGPPLIAYFISVGSVSLLPIAIPYLFLSISVVLYILLFSISPHHDFFNAISGTRRPIYWLKEIFLWRRLGRILLPVLLFNVIFYIFEATFWTLGPIFSQQFPDTKHFSSLFMIVYILPAILAARYAENITHRFGKKRTAYISFICSNLCLLPLGFISTPYYILVLVFFSTIAGSLSWSAISGAFVDYLAESEHFDSDIIGLKDLSANIGYILGPVTAGIISDLVGISYTFTILAIFNIALVFILMSITPKQIVVPV